MALQKQSAWSNLQETTKWIKHKVKNEILSHNLQNLDLRSGYLKPYEISCVVFQDKRLVKSVAKSHTAVPHWCIPHQWRLIHCINSSSTSEMALHECIIWSPSCLCSFFCCQGRGTPAGDLTPWDHPVGGIISCWAITTLILAWAITTLILAGMECHLRQITSKEVPSHAQMRHLTWTLQEPQVLSFERRTVSASPFGKGSERMFMKKCDQLLCRMQSCFRCLTFCAIFFLSSPWSEVHNWGLDQQVNQARRCSESSFSESDVIKRRRQEDKGWHLFWTFLWKSAAVVWDEETQRGADAMLQLEMYFSRIWRLSCKTSTKCPSFQFIENLESCKRLQKLNLSCNVIERIERLDKLTSLKELNLSFNKLSR